MKCTKNAHKRAKIKTKENDERNRKNNKRFAKNSLNGQWRAAPWL